MISATLALDPAFRVGTVDARDVLEDPKRVLTLLCQAVGVDFTERMLSWEPGLRDTDGVWAKYWYKEVETTTSFRPYKPKDEAVPKLLTAPSAVVTQ